MSSLKRKRRSDSQLDRALSGPQKAELEKWLIANMGYEEAAALVAKEFKVATSASAVGRFWQSYVAPRRLVRRARSAQMANDMVEEIASKPGQWDEPLKDALKETAFNLLQQPNPSTEDVMFIMGCVAKAKDQELKESDLKLKREKFELDAVKLAMKHLDALKAIKSDRTLDQAARLQKAREQLFGTLPTE